MAVKSHAPVPAPGVGVELGISSAAKATGMEAKIIKQRDITIWTLRIISHRP